MSYQNGSNKEGAAACRNVERVLSAVTGFTRWLEEYGEFSRDHQTFFAGAFGGWAKRLYYRQKLLGTAVVAPMIACEAFLPGTRRFFHKPTRFPIADAHYAMGFAFLYEATEEQEHWEKCVHFLGELEKSRCEGFKEYCWGYPFDWVTRGGIIKEHTPLITSTPYCFEAFLQAYNIEARKKWKLVLESIVRHVCTDIKDFESSAAASTCSYTPYDKGLVVNAAAYRGFMLTSAAKFFERDDLWEIGKRNLNYVLESQNADGSWGYAMDGVRDFVDHFHTCFVMKALAKAHALTGHKPLLEALKRGVDYYLKNLFAEDGLPRPFAKAPRLTVYKRELYDCAEAINLCLLLRDRFPQLNGKLEEIVSGVLKDWVKGDGSFRARQLMFGWDNVPMHRWAQSQIFRSLAFYLWANSEAGSVRSETNSGRSDEAKLQNVR
jgi:hypothetical protein